MHLAKEYQHKAVCKMLMKLTTGLLRCFLSLRSLGGNSLYFHQNGIDSRSYCSDKISILSTI